MLPTIECLNSFIEHSVEISEDYDYSENEEDSPITQRSEAINELQMTEGP